LAPDRGESAAGTVARGLGIVCTNAVRVGCFIRSNVTTIDAMMTMTLTPIVTARRQLKLGCA
jgi:hypothetical protein